mgnify:CR=1 FL=1
MFKIEKLNNSQETLAYIGHVDNVIKGNIPEELKHKRFLASDFDYGFELGSPQSIYNMGECIMLNGMLYSSRTDVTRTERDPLMWGPEFVTSGIFIIPKEAMVNFTAKYFSFDEPCTLARLYDEIYKNLQAPFAVVGCVELAYIRGASITRAPIDNVNIFENAKHYYEEQEYQDDHVSLAVHAVVSNANDENLKVINQKLSSVLYYNPSAKSEKLLSHTHALKLNKPILNVEDVQPRHATEVLHLMDDSLVRYANLKVYKIGDLREIK